MLEPVDEKVEHLDRGEARADRVPDDELAEPGDCRGCLGFGGLNDDGLRIGDDEVGVVVLLLLFLVVGDILLLPDPRVERVSFAVGEASIESLPRRSLGSRPGVETLAQPRTDFS